MTTTVSALTATAAALSLTNVSSSSSSSSSTDSNYVTTIYRNNIPITISSYANEDQLGDIMVLMSKDLSEPYSVFTYRYFLHQWPKYCLLVSSIR